jgi:hypothetical protein
MAGTRGSSLLTEERMPRYTVPSRTVTSTT